MDIRHQPEEAIRLNVLGGASPHSMGARLIRISGKRAEVRTDAPILCGAAVKIEMEDSLLLGEVLACGEHERSFTVLVQVREAIPSMSDLARLVAAVMNQGRTSVRERVEQVSAAR